MGRRSLCWGSALRDIRADRAARDERGTIYCRPAPASSGISMDPPEAMSMWRGKSGRWYIVQVCDLEHARRQLGAANPFFVAFGVNLDTTGPLHPVCPTVFRPSADPTDFLAAIRRAGCTQVHIHRLAEDETSALAIVADLTPSLASSGLAA